MARGFHESIIINRKITYFFLLVLFLFIMFIGRLFYLQIYKSDIFSKLGEQNFLRKEKILSKRGNVLDCNGNLLVTNRPVFDICWYGSGNFRLSKTQKIFVQKLKSILGEYLDSNLIEKIEKAERFSREVIIKCDIDQEELSKISEQCSDFGNLYIKRRFKRVYPYNNLASHVLGYLRRVPGRDGLMGLYGIERKFQDELQGETGYVCHVTNAMGSKILQREFRAAVDGEDVKVTLDLTLQSIAETIFPKDQSGSFIIIDPEDGAIKAMLSYPNFDPNLFLGSISQRDWQEKFSIDSPMLNRAIHASYPPASIFKLITFVAGLEEGVINSDTEFNCKGYTLFCGRKYNCQRRWGHGLLSTKKALGVSCNVPCYEIAQRVTIDQLAVYAIRFGLGRSTNFLFQDKSGLVPTSYWKQSCRGERWWKGETLSVSIGQSFLLVTPLQVARMVCAICSGYLVKPRILETEEVERYPLYVSDSTVNFLRDVMKEVVFRGTARRLKNFKNFSVWAKTGTAQTVSLKRQNIESKSQLEHAWFTFFFSYKQQKPLACVILIENVGSSRLALSVAERFFKAYNDVF